MEQQLQEMMRRARTLESKKQSKIIDSPISPSDAEGYDGDMRISNNVLYIKSKNKWLRFLAEPDESMSRAVRHFNTPLHIEYELTSDDTPIILLESKEGGATSSPDLKFYRNSTSPADNDFLGHLVFSGKNDAGEQIDYAHIFSILEDVTDGTEDGAIMLRTRLNGMTAPTAPLHIDQASASGAAPVLRLDQGDADETFIDFIGTSAADGSKSISSDTTTDSAKFGAIRIEINGVHKWIRIYDDHS